MSRQMIELFLSARAQEAASSTDFRVGVRNAAGDQPAEIVIDGEIGDPYAQADSRSVGQFLRANKGKPVVVLINSPGGLAYDGITIFNALVSHDGPTTTTITGMAGSAASIIAMGGDKRQIYDNANLFIHRASVIAVGNRDVMEESINWLDKIDEAIARTYQAKTGLPIDTIRKQMRGRVDGTVFSAKEAKSGGWVDEIISPKQQKQGKNSLSSMNPLDSLRREGESRLNAIDTMRAERIRTRREIFSPAE